jgi:hypothetical protein
MKRSDSPGTGHGARIPALISLLLVLVPAGDSLAAGSWTGTLNDGSVLKVDPATHRPMRYYNGGTAPLWDGTHRLEDGTVVIVRDGQAVPTEDMINAWSAEPGAGPQMRDRYCDQLVRKVCGFHDECARTQPCSLARQLLRLEREQQRMAPMGSGVRAQTQSGGKCQDALSNPSFPACSASIPEVKDTPCKKLVNRVCGESGRCGTGPACDPARQLLDMENQERLESADPAARTQTGAQCEEAMNNAFFTPCE